MKKSIILRITTPLLSLALINLALLSTTAALGKDTALISVNKPNTVSKQPESKLHRADFRVLGASCVSCLRRTGKTIREQKGVLKADVSIFKPYWALVIYDSSKITMDKIYESVKKEKVKFEDIEDKPISEIPTVVIPKGLIRTEPKH